MVNKSLMNANHVEIKENLKKEIKIVKSIIKNNGKTGREIMS